MTKALLEGGNVFKGPDKQPLTQRIATGDVEETIAYIEKITGLDFTKEKDLDDKKPVKWLGTTGRKSHEDGTFERNSSGDLDLSVDAKEVDKKSFADKLIAHFGKENVKLSGDNVHWKTPIKGDPANGFVQADFMFSANPKFQQGSMIGGSDAYRGEHRHIVLSSIARARGMKYSPKHGLLNPQTDELLPNGNDWNQIAKDVSVKWDGNPTVYWGRDDDGTFRMVGKNNWGREEGKSSSPEDLKQFIMSRGKGEDWREKFASDMASLWPTFEAATPKDFRGYIYGDILYHPGKPYQGGDGKISFTPNQTTYSVKGTSEIGRRIGKSQAAVAAHKHFDFFGDKTGDDISDVEMFNHSPALVVFGQTYVNHQPAVDADNLGAIEKAANNFSGAIDKLLAPTAGLSDLQTIIYTFVNNQSKAKALDSIDSKAFFTWLQGSKVSAPKQQKISQLSQQHPGALENLFYLVRELMKAKDEIIRELDSAGGDIEQHTGGKPGGEGYMHGAHGVKLVPRDRWTPFRAD